MNRRRSLVVACALACLLCARSGGAAEKSPFSEPDVKAVYLFNFAQFVEWPETAFASRDSSFVICILGDDPFGRTLDEVVKGEVVNGRHFGVDRLRKVEDLKTCHILFVAEADADRFARITAALDKRPILTVGDTDMFTAGGGIVRFVTDRKRVRLRVNVEAAKAANLSISSNLLRGPGRSSPN
jgi:hypothetical protein